MIKNNIALIVAAGVGARSGLDLPKQYFKYDHKTILEHTISCFLEHPHIDYVQVVIHKDHQDLYKMSLASIAHHKKILPVVLGGISRQDSVLKGLKSIKNNNVNYVLIHDAARPFLDAYIIDKLCEALKKYDGAAPALGVTDSLRYLDNNIFTSACSRENLYSVQTPQAFHFDKIYHAHLKASPDHTDDISVGIENGLRISAVQGCKKNMKMTIQDDFKEMMQKTHNHIPDIRIGTGYDVHRLIAGDHVILGGVKIPCSYALKGHSDADVLLHAITDAVLGSASENDIGFHFPPTDNKWENVCSSRFLKYAIDLLHKKNAYINHIDCTLICERPKIGPYRDMIRENIAHICDLPTERVNIKATTTEKLGFTGRKEGIAAEATVTSIFT